MYFDIGSCICRWTFTKVFLLLLEFWFYQEHSLYQNRKSTAYWRDGKQSFERWFPGKPLKICLLAFTNTTFYFHEFSDFSPSVGSKFIGITKVSWPWINIFYKVSIYKSYKLKSQISTFFLYHVWITKFYFWNPYEFFSLSNIS